MIHRYYQEGQKLDVAGLNEITVLIDRSETEMTEVGWNCWRAGLDGPPHKHKDKDQVFYVTNGTGHVRLGDQSFDAHPGVAFYVPAGLVHQTITTGDEPLCYILLNVFQSPDKEGHASFADHIEKVKAIRRQQAESGVAAEEENDTAPANFRPFKAIQDLRQGKIYEFGSNRTILLLDRTETNHLELTVVDWPPGNRGPMVAHTEKEQTFFVLEGDGIITVDQESEPVKSGDLIFVPRNRPHTTEAGALGLRYLCLNSLIIETGDSSFDDMYQRISSDRRRRWESGDQSVGE